jgi:hypothetical protein
MSNTTTKSIRIPKRLKPWENLVIELRELIEKAKRYREAEDDLYEMIFEDVEIEDEGDYERYIHREIPELLYRILHFLRFQGITIYHRKDDINAPEYLVEAVRGKTPYVFELDIGYDYENGEWNLIWLRVTRDARIAEGYLPYYHEV